MPLGLYKLQMKRERTYAQHSFVLLSVYMTLLHSLHWSSTFGLAMV